MLSQPNMETETVAPRALDNTNTADATSPPKSDVKFHGDPDAWVLVCKASSKAQGWMKSTKRMAVPGGWILQVTTEHRSLLTGEVTACAEAIAFVPGDSEEELLNANDDTSTPS